MFTGVHECYLQAVREFGDDGAFSEEMEKFFAYRSWKRKNKDKKCDHL